MEAERGREWWRGEREGRRKVEGGKVMEGKASDSKDQSKISSHLGKSVNHETPNMKIKS